MKFEEIYREFRKQFAFMFVMPKGGTSEISEPSVRRVPLTERGKLHQYGWSNPVHSTASMSAVSHVPEGLIQAEMTLDLLMTAEIVVHLCLDTEGSDPKRKTSIRHETRLMSADGPDLCDIAVAKEAAGEMGIFISNHLRYFTHSLSWAADDDLQKGKDNGKEKDTN